MLKLFNICLGLITVLLSSINSFSQCGYKVDILEIKNISCNGVNNGSIELLVAGASPPYTFNGIVGDNIFKMDSLSGGSHSVQISDYNHCDTILFFNILEPELLLESIDVISFCDTNLLIVSSVGGTPPYEYSLNDGLPILTDTAYFVVAAGEYSIMVEDNMGCAFVDSLSITINQQIGISIDSIIFGCAIII